jgi:hypothetical protein
MGASRSISFVWRDASGLAPPADLWVEAEGRPLVQVTSVDGHPFARSGLEVVALEPGATYRIVLERTDDGLSASVVQRSDEVLLRTLGRSLDTKVAADIVLAGEPWRSSIVSEDLP